MKYNDRRHVFATYNYNVFDELVNYYASMDTMSLDDIWDDIYNQYNDENLANDVVAEIEDMRDEGDAWYGIEGCDTITSSIDEYSQLATPEYTYSVEGYYDSNFQGLVDSYSGNDFSEALDAAHNFVCDGDFVIIKNVQTGRTRSYSTDDWFNAVDMGDYPADVYDIV